MTLRRALTWHLLALHGIVALGGALLLWPSHRGWILVLELGLVTSALCAVLLLRAQRLPHELVAIGSEWMKEGDFSHSFRPTGTADLQRLIELYNSMMERLREERIRSEEQHTFMQRVLEASPSGVITADHDGQVDTVNPAAARLLGVAAEALGGQRLHDAEAPLARALAEIPSGQSRLLGRAGRLRLRCTHSRFFDRGHPRSFYLIEDLTHELWASEKRAYDTLIRTLSHEVNNTIGATNSILHSALVYGDQLGAGDRDDFGSALRVAIERTDHLNAFMRRYAEVVRVPEPVPRPADLVEVLERIARVFEPECRSREIDLRLIIEQRPRPVAIDVAQIEQVFVNVIRNALEAIEQRGEIRLLVGAENGHPVVVVEDTGPGLTPAAAANLFTPFFTTKAQGQGVGLTLVREILGQHGFDFSLESPPGEPTRFTIVFSRAEGG